MKKHLYIFAILALGLLNSCGPVYVIHQDPRPAPPHAEIPPPSQEEQDPEVSYQSFYDQLSPYGQWIDDPGYGYVWMPEVGPDFKPYATNGHWVYTDEGWTWASNYNWGWATFHYGRWFYQDGYGWMWQPGNEWAPAWVSWRNSSDYYGWAPLAPEVSLSVSFGGGYNPPPHYWCFVPHQYIGSPQVRNYYVNESRNVTIIHNTTIINNTTVINNNYGRGNNPRRGSYAGGPDPDEVGRFSGAPVRPILIRRSNAPGEQMNNGQLAIYRPRVNQAPQPSSNNGNGNNSPRFAPSRYQTLNNARPVNTTRYGNNNDNQAGNNNRNDRNWNDRNGNDRNDPRSGSQPAGNAQPGNNNQQQPPPHVNPFRPRETTNQPAGTFQPAGNAQPGNGQPINSPQPGSGQSSSNNPPPPAHLNPFRPREATNQPAGNLQPAGNGQPPANAQPGGNAQPGNNQPQPHVNPFRPREATNQQPANNNPNAGRTPPPQTQPAVQPRPNPAAPRTFTRPAPRSDRGRGRDSTRTRN